MQKVNINNCKGLKSQFEKIRKEFDLYIADANKSLHRKELELKLQQ